MKLKIKPLLLLSTIICFIVFTQYRNTDKSFSVHKSSSNTWTTYRKIASKKIENYPTTKNEKDEMKIQDNPINDNSVSHKKAPDNNSKQPQLPHRPWRSSGAVPLSSEIDNTYNPHWKDKLGPRLLRFLPPHTKSMISRKSSALIKHKGKNLLVEHVAIKLKTADGDFHGYSAYVDSQTGKILKTWNRTIHEKSKHATLHLSPSL